MRRIAFLTLRDAADFMIYDRLLTAPLARRGFAVEEAAWDQPDADWASYEAVIIRSPWDYQQRPAAFMQVLEAISSVTRLENPLDVVRWNFDKRYLADLKNRGVAIVPTGFYGDFDPAALERAVAQWGRSCVLKPAISANADDTYVVQPGEALDVLAPRFTGRAFLLQPFVAEVQSEGEYSVFFFGDVCSHVILKTPKAGDFRVQEEHGGRLALITNPEPGLLEAAWRVYRAIGRTLLYARADLVRHGTEWQLMEVELIEPSLYFNMDPASPERFASVFEAWMQRPG